MRKLITFFLLLWAIVLHAQQITPDEAAAIASEFLNSSSPQLTTAKRISVKRANAKSDAGDNLPHPYYVFNGDDNQGFVIVSGDKRAKKILGYSDTGNFDFDNLPSQLAAMLEQYAEQIKSLPTSATTDPSWDAPTQAASTGEGILLETANWGQGYPYNLQCPEIDGQRCLTGCVATAMAIVMKYHNWPDKGDGAHSYNWNGNNLSFDFNTNFDWANTPNSFNEQSNSEEIANVAKLMSACGIAVDMDYNLSESGAYMSSVSIAMTEHFVFSPLSQYIEKKHYTENDWDTILKYELSLNRPFIYDASGVYGAHAFVCDGFNDTYYHINWGWNGNFNGYFTLTNLNPYDSSNDDEGFNRNATALIGLTPDKNLSRIGKSLLCIYPVGLTATSSKLDSGDNFDLIASDIFCGAAGFDGKIAAVVVDKDGCITSILSEQDLSFEADGSKQIIFSGCKLSSVKNGDMIAIASKCNGSNDWNYILRQPWNINNSAIYPQIYNAQYTDLTLDLDPGVKVDLFDFDYNPIKSNKIPYGTTIRAKVIFDEPDKLFAIHVSHHDFGIVSRELNDDNFFSIEALCQPTYSIKIKLYNESELTSKYIHVENAGSLGSMLSEEDFKLGYLSLSGKINFDDLWNIRYKLPLLVSLNMGQCSYETNMSEGFPGLNTRRFLKHVVLPYDLTAIGQGAFADTSIEEIIIPEGVLTIGYGAFSRCTKLKNISLPSSLQMLAPVCFDGCTSIVEIKIPSQIKELPQNVFSNCENLKTISFEGNILEIGDYAFDGCSKLEFFNTGNNLISIGQRAFAECVSLKNINFPPSLITIGAGAFWNDYSLEKIVIPNSVESLGHSAFYNCNNASELILSDKLTEIHENTFMMCNGYTSLVLGKQVKNIGLSAFSGNYTELYLNSKLKHVSSFGLSSNSPINIYTPATSSFILDEDGFGVTHKNLYIPGKTTEIFSDITNANIIEMWAYKLHKADRGVMIAPTIEDIVIDKVTINGEIVAPTNNIYYYYTSDTSNLDVVIDYTLHGHKTMTTHYNKDFNASLPDTDFSLVKEIVLGSNGITLHLGEKSQISANVLPENAENKTLIWTTNDKSIATVDANGNVTAHAIGEAIITAIATDGSGVSATCQVTVSPIMIKTLVINPETWNGTEGESFQITAVMTPENATNKTVAWSSSDEKVATVDATGYVSVLKGGNCIITASTQDGSGLSAECIITCVSGIDNIFTDADARFDVYNLQGILVKKDCGRDCLKQLSTGAYILHQGNARKKIIIR